MSRTRKGTKAPGYEYWSKRLGVGKRCGGLPGRYTKTKTHRAERREGKLQTREMHMGMTPEEALEKIKEAAEAGEVDFCMSDDENDVLVTDGHTKLVILRNPMNEPGLFGFSMMDGGGWSSVFFSKTEWLAMRKKVDEIVGHE